MWLRAKERQAGKAAKRVKAGLTAAAAGRTGAGPKYLFSSLLRCSYCGSSYVIAGRDLYACSGNVNGGAAVCGNDAKFYRQPMEAELLKGIKHRMRSPAVIAEACRRARAALRQPKSKATDNRARVAELKATIGNITDAIASGMMRPSQALGLRLQEAEAELERLEQARAAEEAPALDIERLIPGLPAMYCKMVDQLEETLAAGDITRSREEIRSLVGAMTFEADEQEIRFYTEQNHAMAGLLRAAGSHAIKFGSGGPLQQNILIPTSTVAARRP